jgi:hypothetical protein
MSRIRPCCDVIHSTAGFRLRDVTLNSFDIGADNGADEMAPRL